MYLRSQRERDDEAARKSSPFAVSESGAEDGLTCSSVLEKLTHLSVLMLQSCVHERSYLYYGNLQ